MFLNLYFLLSAALGICKLAYNANNTSENLGPLIVFSDWALKLRIFQEKKKRESRKYKMRVNATKWVQAIRKNSRNK